MNVTPLSDQRLERSQTFGDDVVTRPCHGSPWLGNPQEGAEQVLPLTGVARESSAQRTRATAVMRGGDTGRLTSEPLETTCTAFNAVKVASLLTSVVVITVPNTA